MNQILSSVQILLLQSPKPSVFLWLEIRKSYQSLHDSFGVDENCQADNLGNMLTEDGNMDHDTEIKRANFINSAGQIGEVFKAAATSEIVKALKV